MSKTKYAQKNKYILFQVLFSLILLINIYIRLHVSNIFFLSMVKIWYMINFNKQINFVN